ncbi:pfs domain-containing protein [Trichoderma camerunense]
MALPQLSDPQQYTVGIITALDKELAAATAVLDEEHQKPQKFSRHPKDTNDYTWGKIGEHNVVIASLAAGSYGTVSAATTASSMITSLPHIRFGLMVGIGAGVPRLADKIDIRLGDVVVSQPTGTSPGVVQYDLGKLKTDGNFERVGHLSAPPEVLLKGLQKLKAGRLRKGSQISTILEDMVRRYPNMKEPEDGAPGFIHQGIQNDRLFMASSIHKDIPTADDTASDQDSACQNCDSTKEIKRKDRSSKPAIHYGVIASGNLVVKDGVSRDEILRGLEEKCICFEMEAAGLMNNFPCLVIRGICDYADTHKNDRWQNYAAATAAAFAKELLDTIDGKDVESAPSIEEAIQHISQEVAQMAESSRHTHTVVQTLETSDRLQELRRWLSPPNPSENYNNGIKQRHGDSGQWFLQSEEYSSWKSRPNSFLWLQGIPGCGKTVLSSTIVKDLKDGNVNSVLYFFFDFTNSNKQLFGKALSSLVLQLYCKNENTQKPLDSLYDSSGKGTTQPSADGLFATFETMLQHAGEIYVILDALDECQPRKEYPNGGLLTLIEALVISQQTNIHLLVTSRPEQDIASSIQSWARKQDIVPVQRGRVADDIVAYVKARVRNNKGPLKRWNERPEVQDEIETILSKKANGMFRWVTCQLDAIDKCLDYPTLQKALNSLPATLDETYTRILTNLPHEHEHHTRRLLQFLVFSERPLRIEEAVDAIAVDTANSPRFDLKNRMPVPEEIISYCSSLVVLTVRALEEEEDLFTLMGYFPNRFVDKGTIQELQLAHLSVKDYLLSNRVPPSFEKDFNEATARASIAQVCLAYLLELDKILLVTELRQSYWLAQYSARYWMDHTVVVESGSKQLCALVAEFFSCEGAQINCYGLYDPDDPRKFTVRRRPYNISSGLYYASLGGSCFLVQLLLEMNADVNSKQGHYGTALVAASRRGFNKIVQILLNNNADINAQDRGAYGTALMAASHKGRDKIVQILLDNNADVNAQGGVYGTALQAASLRGRDKIVQMLLDNNADVNTLSGPYGTALAAASSWGHGKIVQMLLDNNADVNTFSGPCGTALVAASSGGQGKIVQLLLDNGADVNAQSGFRGSALVAASSGGHDKIVQMLLDRGANVNARGEGLGTALNAALYYRRDKIVQMLRDNGAVEESDEPERKRVKF